MLFHNDFLSMAEQAQVSQYPIPLQKPLPSSALKPERFIPIFPLRSPSRDRLPRGILIS